MRSKLIQTDFHGSELGTETIDAAKRTLESFGYTVTDVEQFFVRDKSLYRYDFWGHKVEEPVVLWVSK